MSVLQIENAIISLEILNINFSIYTLDSTEIVNRLYIKWEAVMVTLLFNYPIEIENTAKKLGFHKNV